MMSIIPRRARIASEGAVRARLCAGVQRTWGKAMGGVMTIVDPTWASFYGVVDLDLGWQP